MGFWDWVKSVFGFGKKEEEKPEEEIQKKVDIRDIKEEGETNIKIPKEKKITKEDIESLKDKKEESKGDQFEKRQKDRVKGKEVLTKELKEDIEEQVNPRREVINLGRYKSMEDLKASRFDIYRNIIMKNIDNQDMLNKIYSSGILDAHIVGYITIKGYTIQKGGNRKSFTEKIEVQGLTPDKAMKVGIFEQLQGFEGGYSVLAYKLHSFGNISNVRFFTEDTEMRIHIDDVEISFDYA